MAPIVFYPKWLPFGFKGFAFWPFIFIVRRDDEALLAHELVHYRRQTWWSPLWLLIYVLLPSFRFHEEVLGYREQIKAGGISYEAAAKAISEKYFTFRTYEDTLDALKDD